MLDGPMYALNGQGLGGLGGLTKATPSGPAWSINRSLGKGRFERLEARNGHDHSADDLLPRRDRGELRDLNLRVRPENTEISGNRLRGLGLHGEGRKYTWILA